jgi:hypothetical protein
MKDFRLKELMDKGDHARAWSTRNRYASYLSSWIEPRWRRETRSPMRRSLIEYEPFQSSFKGFASVVEPPDFPTKSLVSNKATIRQSERSTYWISKYNRVCED